MTNDSKPILVFLLAVATIVAVIILAVVAWQQDKPALAASIYGLIGWGVALAMGIAHKGGQP